jgi:hypothetical protein
LRHAKNPRGLTVVTSDAAIAQAARRAGARVKAAGAFARELLAWPQASQPLTESELSADEVEAWEKEFRKRAQT